MAHMFFLGDEPITCIKDVTVASEMTDEHLIYRYLGNEEDYESGKLYYHNGTIFQPVGTGTGGGGGGGSSEGNAAVITAQNTTGWLSKTISYGQAVSLSITWSSLEDDMPTGDGTLQVIVNGSTKRSLNISQGNVTVNVTDYLVAGANTIRLRISDVYGNSRNISFSVKAVQLTLASSFDSSVIYTAGASVDYTYTPTGAVEKTVYFIVDGNTIGTASVTASGRQQTYSLPAMTHGAHSLRVYFTAEVDGETVTSNELYYELTIVNPSSTTAIITSSFRDSAVDQYETISIPYKVYTPNSLTSEVVLKANGETVASLTVDRAEQTWTYRTDNTGTINLVVTSGGVQKTIVLTVAESDIDVEPETNALALYLTSYGRSNSEANPAVWKDTDRNISASMTGFNFISNGWVEDDEGITVLRVSGDARVTIPYKPFASDFRTTGKTFEIEFATRDILNYDAVVFSCMSGGRGIQLTAQVATLASEQSSISTQYKEDEHVTVSFVVEKRNENRLIYIAINGINSGVIQYPADDDFSQMSPVNISIGAAGCTTDIYHIRVYDNDLTRYQILNNWISDTQSGTLMKERFEHNDVYDEYGKIVISKLPKDLPYFILNAEELPQYKGDKKTISGSYVDPEHPAKSFTFTGCQANVQGTSSAPYARKNYDLQFKNGFEMNGGSHEDNYALAPAVIPFNRFVLKADVASSEGANNVELVKLYNDATPYARREQEEDARVRQGIYGFPIVVFWHDTAHNETTFLGKYNFNLPKRAPGPYGYTGNMESWEFQNNTSDLMLFKSDFFDQTMVTDPTTGEAKESWRYDYEARFPSDEWVNYSKLQELQSFIVSCDRSKATGNTLASAVTYGDVTYTVDNAAYRLARFRNEFGKYAEVSSFIFYYIFTELFLMVDSRAKNLFIGFSGGDTTGLTAIDRKAVAEPYDMDTAIGTNNEGFLVFGYSLEDTDHLSDDADVFNGQDSVLWNNVRDAFPAEIVAMYQSLRSNGTLSYESVERRFEEHQAKWSEAIFNEDAYFKYIAPLTDPDTGKEPTDFYLPMLQGSKAEQRKWWLFNRFRYMDSKWNAGDALSEVIQLRGYAKADITVTPYADIYPTVKYASYLVSERGQHGVPTTLACPLDNVNDTEIYIYSASQIASAGDLSGLKVRVADFSKATKIQSIVVGSSASGYNNPNLVTLSIPASSLLSLVDARNCSALAGTIDLSPAANIEEVYFDGTAVTAVTLPVGGILKKLHLPSTVTNLTVRNQPAITEFVIPSYSNITTLRIENCAGAIPVLDILDDIPANSRVRIIGFTLAVTSTSDVEDFFDYLDTMRGLDEYGNNLESAVASGTITGLGTITGAWLTEMYERYPDVTIEYEHIESSLYYYNYDGTELIYTETVRDGGNGTYAGQPSRASTAANTFTFAGWSLYTNQSTADATATQNITRDRNVYAAYTATGRTYTVYFYVGTTLKQTVNNVPYGASATYTEATPVDPSGAGMDFTGWLPAPTNIQGNTSCYAQFASPEPEHTITDTWEEIIQHVQLGDYATRYSVGDTMSLNLGSEGYINMQIVAFDTDDKADGSGKAPITWIAEHILETSHRMNPALETNYVYPSGKSFVRNSSSASNTGYNQWKSQNAYKANNTAKITFTVTAVATGTLRLKYVTGTAANCATTLKIDGTDVITSYSTSVQNYDLAITAGTQYVIEYETTRLNDTNSTDIYIKLCNTSDSGKNADVSALVTQDSVMIEDCAVRTFDSYTTGTGAIGGYAASEMRTYIQETIKPLIPQEVLAAIKPVTKYTQNYNTAGTAVNNVTSTEDVWIPSRREMFTGAESQGPTYTSFFSSNDSRIKKKAGASSASWWWLRSADNFNYFNTVYYSGDWNNYYATSAGGVVVGFCL